MIRYSVYSWNGFMYTFQREAMRWDYLVLEVEIEQITTNTE